MEVHIHIDDKLVDAVKSVSRGFTRRRVAAIASLGVVASSFVADAAPIESDFTFETGDPIVAAEINKNFETLYNTINDRIIRDVVTIPVANCNALIAKLSELEESRILSDGSVTIEIASGTHACPSEVAVDHVDGQRLSIVGADDVTLSFEAGSGIAVRGSRSLGLLSNLTLLGNGTVASESAVYAQFGATIKAQGVVSQAFQNGFRASYGATMQLTECEGVGLYEPEDATTNEGGGFVATQGGTLQLVNCRAESFRDGITATESSNVSISGPVTVANNGRYGLTANRLSFVGVGSSGVVTYDGNVDDVNADNGAIVID